MDKLNFSATLTIEESALCAKLELYLFRESGSYIVYCPALDLSAYGNTETEAKNEFKEIFRLHISYCIDNNTLTQDLKKHGWNIGKSGRTSIKVPNVEQMLMTNETLKDIIFNKNYRKISKDVQIPQFA